MSNGPLLYPTQANITTELDTLQDVQPQLHDVTANPKMTTCVTSCTTLQRSLSGLNTILTTRTNSEHTSPDACCSCATRGISLFQIVMKTSLRFTPGCESGCVIHCSGVGDRSRNLWYTLPLGFLGGSRLASEFIPRFRARVAEIPSESVDFVLADRCIFAAAPTSH